MLHMYIQHMKVLMLMCHMSMSMSSFKVKGQIYIKAHYFWHAIGTYLILHMYIQYMEVHMFMGDRSRSMSSFKVKGQIYTITYNNLLINVDADL